MARMREPAQITAWTLGIAATIVAAVIGAYMFVNRDPSTDTIAEWVKADMQTYFDTDTTMAKYDLMITDLDLIELSDAQYKGIATIHGPTGGNRNTTVTVAWRDGKGIWEIERDQLLWLAGQRLAQ